MGLHATLSATGDLGRRDTGLSTAITGAFYPTPEGANNPTHNHVTNWPWPPGSMHAHVIWKRTLHSLEKGWVWTAGLFVYGKVLPHAQSAGVMSEVAALAEEVLLLLLVFPKQVLTPVRSSTDVTHIILCPLHQPSVPGVSLMLMVGNLYMLLIGFANNLQRVFAAIFRRHLSNFLLIF